MITISLCMIVKNEEEVLRQCLSSVAPACNEIVIVDTGSTDGTKEIANDFKARVFDFEWVDDFAKARQYAFDQATSDYILWLDADDQLSELDMRKLIKLKRELPDEVDAVSMLYHISFDAAGTPNFTYRRNRLVKRERGFRWIGAVHEYLEVGGNILASDIAVRHMKSTKQKLQPSTRRNLEIYERRKARGEEFNPRDLFYYANELKDHGDFGSSILYYEKFLETRKGWVEDEIRACLNLSDCHNALGHPDLAFSAMLRTMNYDVPRPEASCKIGDTFKGKARYREAAFWYRLAFEVKVQDSQGFVLPHYSTWYPHLQLVVCCWELGDQRQAIYHNDKAGEYLPDSPQVKHNRDFFEVFFKDKLSPTLDQPEQQGP